MPTTGAMFPFLRNWLKEHTPEDVQDMIHTGGSILDEIRPYEGTVRTAKLLYRHFEADANEVLTWMSSEFPKHAEILFVNGKWWKGEVDKVIGWANSL